ncbi:MAG TPA: hypothetical protein VN493_12655 [Thermoanaerobaculia bacterium]|nr:hypothetical protein [Thermoanaerobaculia bacterium]
MRHIAQMVGQELRWNQPRAPKMEYELRAGEELVATLRFRSSWGSFATAESADGCWTFKRVGFWQTRVTVRPCESEAEIATFRQGTWSAGGTLELPDGRKYLASTNFWQTQYEIQTESGEPLIRFRTGGVLRMTAQMEIEPMAAELPELPWMAMLGFYLAVMMRNDSAAAAAG